MADTEALTAELNKCAEAHDFETAFKIVRENRADLAKVLKAVGIRDALKKATGDRTLLSFLDGVEFGALPFDESLLRLEKLISFSEGTLVLNSTWGLGKVRRVDYFYRRITVDFKTRKGHQFTYAAATDMLERAPDDHILVMRESDPTAFETLVKDKPGEFLKQVIRSNGSSMTLIRLEDYCIQNSLVKQVNWKKFWERARTELRGDKTVVMPVKKTEPIQLRAQAEDYGGGWLTAFVQETDPKLILAAVRELKAQGKFLSSDDATKAKIEERLAFAVTAARKVDDALYARLACQVVDFGFHTPCVSEMRDYLWERKRYVKAAVALPAREVGQMIKFLAVDDAAKAQLYAAIPELCFTAVGEIIAQFGNETACREAVAALMKLPKAPATLTTLLAGKVEAGKGWKFSDWKELPPFITVLAHAVALGEGRQGGETLKMQNIIRRLFANVNWLTEVFSLLSPADRALFFERFQASIAWDPSTHHTIVSRMTRIAPELEAHVVRAEKKKEYAPLTSYRSFALRKAEYLKLINEDMPANVKRIEFAKSYGDLSENAEYQYAKDEQRALMQKQTVMQQELETVKPYDFADASVEEVMPGVTVVVSTPEGEKTYHILGEWDNDLDLGILSSKTRLAQNLLGKKAGDSFELPGEGATQFGRLLQIKPLPDDIRTWMKLPEGMQI